MGNGLHKAYKKKGLEERVIIQGLYNAGKRTILYKLQQGEISATTPPSDWYPGDVTFSNLTFTSWELGGRCGSRALYLHFYKNTRAVIFVVDSTVTEPYAIDIVKYELHSSLKDENLEGALFLVLANKQDLPEAQSVETITEQLELKEMKNKVAVFGTSATEGSGLFEALEWMTTTLEQNKNEKDDKKEKVTVNGKKDVVKPGVITRAGDFLTKGIKAMKLKLI